MNVHVLQDLRTIGHLHTHTFEAGVMLMDVLITCPVPIQINKYVEAPCLTSVMSAACDMNPACYYNNKNNERHQQVKKKRR